ncbi:hypothetical protein RND81_04G063100 [Saponaria officinalis]|uniref:Small ribosomal subunit protein mS35 mitochondrial conserved domain-containing protein n=1 Tax=Saponaria officinalis TaxID=3572 RepID=A0AAW1LD92_SAPOF
MNQYLNTKNRKPQKRSRETKEREREAMRRALLKNVSLYISSPQIHRKSTQLIIPKFNLIKLPRFFSSESDSSDQNPINPNSSSSTASTAVAAAVENNLESKQEKDVDFPVEDVSNEELKSRIEKYFNGDEEALPSIFEAILSRKLSGNHEDTDDELVEELQFAPLEKVEDKDFESDFEEAHETDDDVPNLYSAKDIVVKRMMEDEYFNMNDKKWDDIVDEAKQKGFVRDTKECEEILEDMLYWDKLLPEDIKQKVQAKYDELGEKLERNELEAEEAYEQFKVFEDAIVAEHIKKDEEERLLESDEVTVPEDNKSDDPPGVGPILRWQTRIVFAPGGDAWHPKNRKVKLSVTVKELGLSKYQYRRLREIVGKRYHPGKDELTITSERFEHREENRKDCLRTLLSIIEEAGKANALVDEARTAYVKQRLKANPAFMARLHAKTKQAPTPIAA